MKKVSAGMLMYRIRDGRAEVLLAHPGGPFWEGKDEGAWTMPKGLCGPDEDLLSCAAREFSEETGFDATGEAIPLGELRQPSGKIIHAWAFEGDCDPEALASNTFSMEWPPRSGKVQDFPEVDRAAWFSTEEAIRRIIRGQSGFIERLAEALVSARHARQVRK